MKYEDFLTKAEQLEKEAHDLRLKAEESKKAAEAKKAREAHVIEANRKFVDAAVEYLSTIMPSLTDNEKDTIRKSFAASISETGKQLSTLNALLSSFADTPIEKPTSAKNTLSKDEEKIFAFLRGLF